MDHETPEGQGNTEASFEQRTAARMRQIDQKAARLTKELGLPPEQKGVVMKAAARVAPERIGLRKEQNPAEPSIGPTDYSSREPEGKK